MSLSSQHLWSCLSCAALLALAACDDDAAPVAAVAPPEAAIPEDASLADAPPEDVAAEDATAEDATAEDVAAEDVAAEDVAEDAAPPGRDTLILRGEEWAGHDRKLVYAALEDVARGGVILARGQATVSDGSFEWVWAGVFDPNSLGYLLHFFFDTSRDMICNVGDQAFSAFVPNTFLSPVQVTLRPEDAERTSDACEHLP